MTVKREFDVAAVFALLDKLQQVNQVRLFSTLPTEETSLCPLKFACMTLFKAITKKTLCFLLTAANESNSTNCTIILLPNTCHFTACYRGRCQAVYHHPEATHVSTSAYLHAASLRGCQLCVFFFACKQLLAGAKRADGQTAGCPTALLVSFRLNTAALLKSSLIYLLCWSLPTWARPSRISCTSRTWGLLYRRSSSKI